MTHPYYPIVFIRGYAATQGAIEATVATPYMGFNLGSTKLRQTWTRETEQYIFESPLIRLGKDHAYRDVYQRGDIIPKGEAIPERSVWIFRYYDQASQDLSPDGDRPEMETYATQFAEFLSLIRDRICGEPDGTDEVAEHRERFRVHLVAHSMGGLIARCYLQNISQLPEWNDHVKVDKVFTYATPHNGIDLKVAGNLLTSIPINNVENFNRARMRQYLELQDDEDKKNANMLGEKFPAEKFFSLIGTDYRDYNAARHAIGPMSDGLVRMKNAYVTNGPRAYVHRAHSGDYGIVNSEEGYQNLRRFLFGDVRVDVLLDIEDITLPPDLQKMKDDDKEIRASYHIDLIASVRGTRWDLYRRTYEEESAKSVDYERIKSDRGPVTLATTYLMRAARVSGDPAGSLGYSLDLAVRVPEYVVNGFLWMDQHYEGGFIFRDKFNFELKEGSPPDLRYGLDSKTTNRVVPSLRPKPRPLPGSRWEFRIPINDDNDPRLIGSLIIRSSPWNQD